jgi:Family of unknown function (DUF5519)
VGVGCDIALGADPESEDQTWEAQMSYPPSASRRITQEVASWPGVQAGYGARGEFGFRVGGRELGHLHGDYVAHFSFPKKVGVSLREQERVVDHPVFPGKPGFAARAIRDENDIRDVIELMRLNYDRIVARSGVPSREERSVG